MNFAIDNIYDSLGDALKDADVFIGLSQGNILSQELVKTDGTKCNCFCNG